MKILLSIFFIFLCLFAKAQVAGDSVKSAREHIIEQEKNRRSIPNIVHPRKMEPLKDSTVVQNKDTGDKRKQKNKKCIFKRKSRKGTKNAL